MVIFEFFLLTIFIINTALIISMYFIDKFKFNKMLKSFLFIIIFIFMYYINHLLDYYRVHPFKRLLDILIISICFIETIVQIARFIKVKIKFKTQNGRGERNGN